MVEYYLVKVQVSFFLLKYDLIKIKVNLDKKQEGSRGGSMNAEDLLFAIKAKQKKNES
jgi:hypothetical protein